MKRWIESNGLKLVDNGPTPTYVTNRGNSVFDQYLKSNRPVTNVGGHRRIIGTIALTARQDIPTIKYERVKLENLKDADFLDRLNTPLTT